MYDEEGTQKPSSLGSGAPGKKTKRRSIFGGSTEVLLVARENLAGIQRVSYAWLGHHPKAQFGKWPNGQTVANTVAIAEHKQAATQHRHYGSHWRRRRRRIRRRSWAWPPRTMVWCRSGAHLHLHLHLARPLEGLIVHVVFAVQERSRGQARLRLSIVPRTRRSDHVYLSSLEILST